MRTAGYECDDHNNPPDFFLDVMNGDSTAVQALQGQFGLLDPYDRRPTR